MNHYFYDGRNPGDALETRYDEQFAQVFEAIKQLISADKARKAKRPIGFL